MSPEKLGDFGRVAPIQSAIFGAGLRVGHIGQIPIFGNRLQKLMVDFSWQKKICPRWTPAVFQEKNLQVEVCLMFMTGPSEACPYCFPLFSLPNLQFSMHKSLSGRTGVLISWPL